MHASAFPVTGPFSKEVSENTFFLAVGFFKEFLVFSTISSGRKAACEKIAGQLREGDAG